MPTNNILLFDQNKGNMMGDEEYSTNTQRLNGVQTGIASSQLQNKFQYQVSPVAYAIASLMYNNGLDANDANAVSAFVSNLSGTLVQKVLDKANTQEAQLGTVDTKWMSPALVKAAIDYCHANAITFGSNVTVGGNLLVSGTSRVNGAATFASTSTFTGTATFNGVAQGQTPTANSHFATKGYVDSLTKAALIGTLSYSITQDTQYEEAEVISQNIQYNPSVFPKSTALEIIINNVSFNSVNPSTSRISITIGGVIAAMFGANRTGKIIINNKTLYIDYATSYIEYDYNNKRFILNTYKGATFYIGDTAANFATLSLVFNDEIIVHNADMIINVYAITRL